MRSVNPGQPINTCVERSIRVADPGNVFPDPDPPKIFFTDPDPGAEKFPNPDVQPCFHLRIC